MLDLLQGHFCNFVRKFGEIRNYSDLVEKCKKNTSCLAERPGQTVQTQIRLLLKKQSDQGLPFAFLSSIL